VAASLAGQKNLPPLIAVFIIYGTVIFKRDLSVGTSEIENVFSVSGSITLGLHAGGNAGEFVIQGYVVLQLISGFNEGSGQSSLDMPLNMTTVDKY
jgi:hypothetical protein